VILFWLTVVLYSNFEIKGANESYKNVEEDPYIITEAGLKFYEAKDKQQKIEK
jgi:hypothetical protein